MFLTVPSLLPRPAYFNCAKWVTLGSCSARKGAFLRAFILNYFFFSPPTYFPWRGNQLLVVKRRLINCPLSCRIAWFLKKRTKAPFFCQDSSILFRAPFSKPHRISCTVYQTQVLTGPASFLFFPFNALVNRADWFVTSCSFKSDR